MHPPVQKTAALEAFYAGLSGESRRTRFFSVAGRPSAPCPCPSARPTTITARGSWRWSPRRADGASGSSATCLEPAGGHVAEVAVAVADDVQHQGIGRRLLDAGVRWALAEGFTTLTASAFIGNAPIHHLLAGLGRESHASDAGSGIEDIRIDLRTARLAAPAALGHPAADQQSSQASAISRTRSLIEMTPIGARSSSTTTSRWTPSVVISRAAS